jgi:dipeptidyl aminopeptidase/acylaminoacyl peptidase
MDVRERRPAWTIALGVLVALVAGATLVIVNLGVRAYRGEASGFTPPRGPLRRPPPTPAFEGLREVAWTIPGGVSVRGWSLPSRNRAAVVFAHGSPGDRTSFLEVVGQLHAAGYGALTFDFPGHGESGGAASWGDGALAALGGAVDVLAADPQVDRGRIGAFAHSMGTAIVTERAAGDPRLAAVVLVAAFTSYQDQLRFEFRRWGPITQWPALWAARRAGLPVERMRPLDAIGRIAPRPLFLIQGTADFAVPPAMARALDAAAGSPHELWLVEGGGHNNLPQVAGARFAERVRAFYDRALLGR